MRTSSVFMLFSSDDDEPVAVFSTRKGAEKYAEHLAGVLEDEGINPATVKLTIEEWPLED